MVKRKRIGNSSTLASRATAVSKNYIGKLPEEILAEIVKFAIGFDGVENWDDRAFRRPHSRKSIRDCKTTSSLSLVSIVFRRIVQGYSESELTMVHRRYDIHSNFDKIINEFSSIPKLSQIFEEVPTRADRFAISASA